MKDLATNLVEKPDQDLVCEPDCINVEAPEGRWYALWTTSHCEQLVHGQLVGKGFHAFLPTLPVWSRRNGRRHVIPRPMFPGYLFVRHPMDHFGYVEILKLRGLVCILGRRWDQLVAVPDREVEAIQRVISAKIPVFSHPYLREGQRVRVCRGPLTGGEGLLVRGDALTGRLVLSIHLFQRSVAVEVDCSAVIPA